AQFLWSFTRLTQSIRRVINDRVSFIHWFKDESSIREIQMQALMYAIERMKTYISTSKGATEDAAQVMVDMQRKLRIMQRENRDMISITDAAVVEDQADEILTASLRLEFSKIQELLDREEIDPACAKRLRDNVHIMRMQLEEHI
ncbi:MAG: hypothetical protein IJV62_04870, partial [Eggerthellaceae bacterium]|nr:hypothetical protein [Eggerthellaceae bacterium]